MERREIEIFLTLAEELHFGRTAQRLYVSQARVSQAIADLERRYGVALFERTSRRVALTPIGRQLANEVRAGRDRIDRGIAAAVTAGRGIDGQLQVGMEAPAVADVAADVFDLFRTRHPRTELVHREADPVDPLATLRAGEVDVLVTNAPVDEPDLEPGPVLLAEPVVLAVPARHPLAGHASVSLDDLGGQVVFRAGRRSPPYWSDDRTGWTTPAGAAVHRGPGTATFQEILGLVAGGRGVCPLAAHAAVYFARPGLVYVPFDAAAPPVSWMLTWPRAGTTERVRALARAAADAVADR